MRVVWLSRHEMTATQKESLAVMVREYVGSTSLDPTLDIVQRNETFPAKSGLAVRRLREIAEEEGLFDARNGVKGIFAGVLPAHIAARVARQDYGGIRLPTFLVPVSVPAPAVEGEVRGGGFVHSHWEYL